MSNLKVYKFCDLYEMSSGISSKPEQSGHGTPFVSFKTVFNNYFLPEQLEDRMHTSQKEQEIYSVLEGDIFLTRTSETLDELGMSSVAFKDYPSATYSGFLKRLRPKQNDVTYHKFMAFYLRSKLFRSSMNNNAIMTLRASLNEQIFSYLDLVLPPYEEQKKVGDLLFNLYTKIELNNKINAELEAMAKTLYDYWFVQFDFPDAYGKPYKSFGGKMVYDATLKREIPKGWEVMLVDDILKKGISNKKISAKEYLNVGKVPIIDQSTDFIAGFTNHQDCCISVSIDEPAIIFGDHTRILKLINFDFARGADGTQILFSNDIRVPQYFLYHSLLKIDLSNYGYARHFKFLKGQLILVPDKDVALDFSTQVKLFYKKLLINQKQNQELASLRDWLLPMLMNGQVTVGEVEEKMGMVAEEGVEYGK